MNAKKPEPYLGPYGRDIQRLVKCSADDAIMIELCVTELKHEVEAYEDFVVYRNEEAERRGVDPATLKTERVEWAEARRVELLDRMKRRRLQSYSNSGNWRPSLFKFGG